MFQTWEIDTGSAEGCWSQCNGWQSCPNAYLAGLYEPKWIYWSKISSGMLLRLFYYIICLPLTLGNSGMTVVTQFYWTAWMAGHSWLCIRTTFLTKNKLVSIVHMLWIVQNCLPFSFWVMTCPTCLCFRIAVENLDNWKFKNWWYSGGYAAFSGKFCTNNFFLASNKY